MSKTEWVELDFEEAMRTGQIPYRGFTSLCGNLGPEMAGMKPDFYGPDDSAAEKQLKYRLSTEAQQLLVDSARVSEGNVLRNTVNGIEREAKTRHTFMPLWDVAFQLATRRRHLPCMM